MARRRSPRLIRSRPRSLDEQIQHALLAGAVGLAVSAPAAAQFSQFIIFGDSLSDTGFYRPVVPPGAGLFTTNPGPIWVTVLGDRLLLSTNPINVPGGTNFAQGGARVTGLPGIPPIAPTGSAVPIATQVQTFLGQGAVNPTALYSVFGGGNDFFYQLGLLQAGQATPAQVQAALGAAAVALATQVATLGGAGARYILAWNLPDAGRTPGGVASGNGAAISQLTSFFNTTYNAALDASGVQAIRLNTFAFFNEVLANPAAFGIVNTTTSACTVPQSLYCTSATLVSPTAPQTFLFADTAHPTTAGHQLLADYAYSFIAGPQQIAALGDAPFAVEEANFRAIDGRMWSSLNTPRGRNKFEAWAVYDYNNVDTNYLGNGSSHGNTVVVGGDIRTSDHTLVGLSFGYTDERGDLGSGGGNYKLRQPTGTVYAGWGDGPWYLGATFGASSLDYSDINRVVPLGALVRTESGQTRGNEYTGRLLGGYWFQWQNVLHGPWARVAYTRATIKQYAERGSDSTALIFGEQKPEQLLWSLGWQAQGTFGMLRPFARAAWEYESLDNDRSVNASSVTLGGLYSVPVNKPDNNYAMFNLGASADFGGVTGFVYGTATAARSDSNYWAITVGIRAPAVTRAPLRAAVFALRRAPL
jgi:outer membrane lipase/esterase